MTRSRSPSRTWTAWTRQAARRASGGSKIAAPRARTSGSCSNKVSAGIVVDRGHVPDAIVIGSGPNGLTAAAYLARAGWSVLVLEASATPGGAVRTKEVTLPGFHHDLGAAFFPFGQTSPALLPLDLPGAGLVWRHAPMDSAHPAPDGTCATIGRDLEASVRAFGEDGEAWRRIALWHQRTRERMLDALLSTLPAIGPALRLGPSGWWMLARVALSS